MCVWGNISGNDDRVLCGFMMMMRENTQFLFLDLTARSVENRN